MDFSLLADHQLLLIVCVAAAVALFTTLNVAARPAAVKTKQVALALAVSSIFFMITRFANLFYLPIMANYVDTAVRTGAVDKLYHQIQWVVLGSASGAFLSWIMLPTFVAIYERGIAGVQSRGSMLKVLLGLPTPRGIRALFQSLRSPLQLKGWVKGASRLPKDFLLWNVFATAVWTVGALCSLYVSALLPHLAATSVLLSGLVNSFAAIAFALLVDPKASVITDAAVKGQRPAQDVHAATFCLGLGNFLGGLLGLVTFPVGVALIKWATLQLGSAQMAQNMWLVIALNMLVCLLMASTLSSRISAVLTKSVATAMAVYNVFFLITRLAGQVYAPILGAVRDSVVTGSASAESLVTPFRWVIWGASLGYLLGWLLLNTFVEIYNVSIRALEARGGSMSKLIKDTCKPRNWPKIWACWRRPSNFGVTFSSLRQLPQGFLWANVIVVAIHVIGVMAAIQAGAHLSGSLARTATLLSSVINGVATILASIIVDPTAARITDQSVHEERPLQHVQAMVVFLCAGSLLGSLLSQILFLPSAQLIVWCAQCLQWLLNLL